MEPSPDLARLPADASHLRAHGQDSASTLPDVPSAQRTRRLTNERAARALTVSCALAACAWVFAVLRDSRNAPGFEWVNHDVAFNLYTGRLLLDGQRLYVDRFEINPPGIFFLSGLIDRTAGWVHLPPVLLFHGFVLALGLFGLLATQTFLRRASASTLTFVSLAFLCVLMGCGLPGEGSFTYAFGQREHLFALVLIPYLFWRMSSGIVGPLVVALLAFVGFFAGMKPHFFVLVIAVEAIAEKAGKIPRGLVWGPRLALLGGAALPYVGLLVHSQQSFVAFFTEVIPRYFNGVYGYFNQPYSTFWASPAHRWILCYAGATGYLLWPAWKLLSRQMSLCVTIMPPLAYGLVIAQHKFWEYHSIVVASLLLVLGSFLAATLMPLLPGRRRHVVFAMAVVAAFAMLVLAGRSWQRVIVDWKNEAGVDAELLKAVPYLRDRPRALYYSTSNVHTLLPLFLRQHEVGQWGHDFLFPAIIRDPSVVNRKETIDRYCAEQKQLIRQKRPDAIVFHATGQALVSREQDVDRVLVRDCQIVPTDAYVPVPLPGAERVALFLRR